MRENKLNSFEVDLGVPPGSRGADLDMTGVRHRDWNARVLSLMSSVGLINLNTPPTRRLYEDGTETDVCEIEVLECFTHTKVALGGTDRTREAAPTQVSSLES